MKEVAATAIAFEIGEEALTLYVGKTYSPTIAFVPENTTNKTIVLSSSDESIVSVADALLVANKAGHATITATSANGKKAMLAINVVEILPTDIQVDVDAIELLLGESYTLFYQIVPSDATNPLVTLQTDESIVALDKNTLTGVALGETTLLLQTHNGIQKEVAVSVLPVPITTLQIKTDAAAGKKIFRLIKKQSLPIAVVIEPKNATAQNYEWHVENPAVAEIIDGHIVFKSYGKTMVTAQLEDFSDSIEIVYYNPLWGNLLRVLIAIILLFIIFLIAKKFWRKRKPAEPTTKTTA